MQKSSPILAAIVLWRMLLAMLVFQGTASAQTLKDFGYQSQNVNGKLALGTRPLLLIVVNFAGETTLPQNAAYFSNMVFNLSQYPSVNGYFAAVSNGRYSWTLAGVVSLNLPASERDATWPGPAHDPPYMSNIVYQAMASGQFNFKAFDANGDSHITQDELGIIILGNDFTACRYTGGPVTSPDGSYDWSQGAALIGTSLVNNTPFITWCEEFEETLGITDIYGANNFSRSLTPQSENPHPSFLGDTGYWDLYYLDPWQRMVVGWCSPRIVSMAAGGVFTIPAAQAGDPTAPVILYDPAHGTSEFWMLEYRTQTSPYGPGYDANVAHWAAGSENGLVVWHIQQDSNHTLLTMSSNAISGNSQPTEWSEGSPNLAWGGNNLWGSDTVTPVLAWMNGVTTNTTPSLTHLHVRPFNLGDGSITVDVLTAGDTWVDFNYTGSPQAGTFANPFKTIAAGIIAAPYGSTLHLKTGTNSETPTILKALKIVGYNGPATVGK